MWVNPRRGIIESLVGNEQNELGEEQNFEYECLEKLLDKAEYKGCDLWVGLLIFTMSFLNGLSTSF